MKKSRDFQINFLFIKNVMRDELAILFFFDFG
jgi:hypothetical protein